MDNRSNKKQNMADALLNGMNGKIDKESIDAARKGDANALLNRLNSDDKQKIQSLLNDKAALKRLLESEDVKRLMKGLGGSK